jgi:predicted aspartyl protease
VRASTVFATVILFAVPMTAVSADRAITPFDLLEDGSIVVPVTIGGTGRYRFVLDTGSSRTVISSRLWKMLRLPVVAKTLMVTPAGREDAYVVRLRGIAVGGGAGIDVDAAVIAADRYAAGQQIDGLIGQDVLASAIYTIDYRARAVVWHGAGDVLSGVRLPLLLRDNRVLVSLAQREGDPRPLNLIPDSGSDCLVLFAHAREKLRFTSLDVSVLSSLSAVRLARRVDVEGLMIGNTRLHSTAAVMLDKGEAADAMGDGLLPMHLFSRVTFNAAEGYLIVQIR